MQNDNTDKQIPYAEKYNLHESLARYCASDMLPMHMPGHKRNHEISAAGYEIDITEISGFDNLHNPTGIIANMAADLSSIYRSRDCLISVNGSTGLIIPTVLALGRAGEILICSNCHISVWHGLELSGTRAHIIPPSSKDEGFAGEVLPDDIERQLSGNPKIKSVIITSPTYEGIISDTEAIFAICRKYGVILVVDSAHGAHLGLHPYFPGAAKADIVITSLHKTLNSPTQTALLLFYNDFCGGSSLRLKRLIRHYLDITMSSSPSYILLNGISKCLSTIKKPDGLVTWIQAVRTGREMLRSLVHLNLFPSDDPSKFVIMCGRFMSGSELADLLREKYRIEVEAAFPEYIIAMSGIGDTVATISYFAQCLLDIDSLIDSHIDSHANAMHSAPKDECAPITEISSEDLFLAVSSTSVLRDYHDCTGEKCGCYVFAYPPGIPVIFPSETITKSHIELLDHLAGSGVGISCEPPCPDGQLLVVDTNCECKV